MTPDARPDRQLLRQAGRGRRRSARPDHRRRRGVRRGVPGRARSSSSGSARASIALHAEDDGSRINVGCGATDLRRAASSACARRSRASTGPVVGVAFDGDADRALFVDETGATLSGDHVMLVARARPAPPRRAAGRHRGRHGDDQHGLREGARARRHPAAARGGRRPLRARGDARRRLPLRRRAVRPRDRPARAARPATAR